MSPQRLLILFFILLLAAGALFCSFDPSPLLNLLSLWIIDLPVAILWTLAAGGLGCALLKPIVPKNHLHSPLALVSCFALGYGAQSLLLLLLGILGLLHAIPIILLAVLPLAGWTLFPFKSIVWPKKITPLAMIPLAAVACALVAASIPPGLLWSSLGDPHAYDILEYHLQIPREWHDLHRITPLAHNAYSWFPFNLELHYLAAMFLRGGPYGGIYVAQYLNLFHMILAGLALGAAARSKWPILIFSALPWVFLLGTVPYNESAILLYGALAVAWSFHHPSSSRNWLIAGAFAGLAAGAKYTAVPLLFIAWPISLIIWKNRSALRHIALYLLAAIVLFSPWLIRNAIAARNPVFPEAMSLLGKGPFTEGQKLRWEKAHGAAPSQRSIVQRLKAFDDQILRDARYAYFLLPSAIVCAFLFRKHPHALPLLTFLALLILFWLVFTHLQSRFFILMIIPASLLIPLCQEKALTRWIAPLNLLAGPVCLLVLIVGMYNKHPELSALPQTLGLTQLDQINELYPEKIAPDQKIILIGDAQAFLFPVPSSQLRYKTIFDINPDPAKPLRDAWLWDDVKPNDILIENPAEIDRLNKTYLQDK